MIIWLTGQTGSGKTTLAKELEKRIPNSIIIDGDRLRKMSNNPDLSIRGRMKNNILAADIALDESRTSNVIVAVICPYEILRKQISRQIDPKWIYVHGGHKIDEEHPFEIPMKVDINVFPDMETPEEEAIKVIDALVNS